MENEHAAGHQVGEPHGPDALLPLLYAVMLDGKIAILLYALPPTAETKLLRLSSCRFGILDRATTQRSDGKRFCIFFRHQTCSVRLS